MPRHSEELLQLILANLKSDSRVMAVWFAGSRGRGSSDEISDIDIWVAVADHAMPDVVNDPLAFVHDVVPTIMHVIAPEIAPDGGAFVGSWVSVGQEFEQVDWYLTPASASERSADTRLVFGDVAVSLPEPTQILLDHRMVEKVNDNLVLALQMISNTFKYHQRCQPWRVVNSARHANDCLAKAEFILRNEYESGYYAHRRSYLPEDLPQTGDEVTVMIRGFIDAVEDIAGKVRITERLSPAISAIRTSILSE